jgi:putative Holliday junction resolvase
VAICDPDRILATPVGAVARSESVEDTLAAIGHLLDEFSVTEFVVGLPVNLTGDDTASTQDARMFAESLQNKVTVPVHLIDERLTTRIAQNKLYAAGRNSRNSKSIVDAAAAVEILNSFLDQWRLGQA